MKSLISTRYAGILKDLGLLSKGDPIFTTASEFVGPHVGQSEAATRKILQRAEGCVLVIDEAYALFPGKPSQKVDSFRAAVLNTITEVVQNVPGEDRCVIMIGYPLF